ncbi:hypothetical protein ACFWP5_08940 [Streptomyces sp. NPDC058469]|uniref:hypothetical protein n=1 Tax=Streptomyces sp. NPDC058469 TaxID=3346514 RepID=UPI003652F1EA
MRPEYDQKRFFEVIPEKIADTPVEAPAEVVTYGNADINEVIAYFETAFNLTMPRAKQQRWAAKRMLTKHGMADLKQVIDAARAVRGIQYAPVILSLEDLAEKWNKLAEFYRKQRNNKTWSI